jgi:hypothetical protein
LRLAAMTCAWIIPSTGPFPNRSEILFAGDRSDRLLAFGLCIQKWRYWRQGIERRIPSGGSDTGS